MNGGGEGSPPWDASHGEGYPPPPIKGSPLTPSHSHLLVKDLSPLLELFPHGLGLATYMFPVEFRLEGVDASTASLERGGGGCSVPRMCVRARMRRCFAALGLPLDLEIGKISSTLTTSSTSLSVVSLQGYVLYGCISARCLYLVDRSWYIVVPIVGIFCFLCREPYMISNRFLPIG